MGLNFEIYLLAALCFAQLISHSSGIVCYDCLEFDKECLPNKLKNCTGDGFCYKFRTYFQNKAILKKGCTGRDDEKGCRDKHFTIPFIVDTRGDYCACKHDFCNHAAPVAKGPNGFVLTFLAFGSYALLYFAQN